MSNSLIPFFDTIDDSIVKGRHGYFYTANGKRYIDFESGDWAAALGHPNTAINAVISRQIPLIMHDGLFFRKQKAEALSKILLEKLGMKAGESVFLSSGSEAVNLSLILATKLTDRDKILTISGSFLGSYGIGQVSEDNQRRVNINVDDFDSIEKINFDEIAAFVFEPGSSWGDIKFPASDFVDMLQSRVKKSGGLLIANEVTTGFGRTGKWFGFQHYNFTPDIVAMGKIMGNGYPVSAVSINKETALLFRKNKFRYAQSHQNDPLGCAVATEVIRIIEEEKLIDRVCEKGGYLKKQLLRLQSAHIDKIKEVKARGLMIAVEFFSEKEAERISGELMERGFVIGQKNNNIRFMPPFVVTKQSIDLLIKALKKIV